MWLLYDLNKVKLDSGIVFGGKKEIKKKIQKENSTEESIKLNIYYRKLRMKLILTNKKWIFSIPLTVLMFL